MSLLISHFYRFGEFTIDVDQRILLNQGKPLPVAPKVLDTLLILVEQSGRLVEKEELMSRLWPDTFVEESNLTYNIQQLRKALGDNARIPRYIETVPRRGYRFIAQVEEVLSDANKVNDQIVRRFDFTDAQADDELNRLPVAQEPGAEVEPAKTTPSPAPATASTSLKKRPVAVASAILILLAVAAILVWKFTSGPNSSSLNQRIALATSPLKLEKLTGTGQSWNAAISPDGRYIAYTRSLEKKYSIWLRQLASNTNVEIVPATGVVHGLAFSSSGEFLYFVKSNPAMALYRVSSLGGVPTKLIDDLEGAFSVSADDRQIAFIRKRVNRGGQQEYSLMIAGSDGTGERALLTTTHPSDLNVPAWSPDSQSIVCAYGSSVGGSQDVSIVEITVGNAMKTELTTERFFHISRMAWLPHKRGLIMSARKNFGDTDQLWRLSFPGSKIAQITDGLISYEDLSLTANAEKLVASEMNSISDIWIGSSREPRTLKKITQATGTFCWTPNGQIVYSSRASGNVDLWLMQPDGTSQKQLTANAATNGTPAVTPDNRYIVFMSNRSGSFQVWRMDMDGANQIQLTTGVAKNFPAVSPDGKWVLYNTTDDWHVWKVSIDGGEPFMLTEYPASYPSASPDGKMIACLGRTESRGELLILPFEGGQPLKRSGIGGGDFTDYRIQWTPDGKSLIYVVGRNGVEALVKQPLDGGPAQEIVDFGEDDSFDFGYSVDGQSLAVTRGSWHHDIVLISDLTQLLK